MSFMEIKFRSKTLCRQVPFYLILPDDTAPEIMKENPFYCREPKTLMLLGGYGNSELCWIYGTAIMALAAKYNLAVILPAGENSFYVDRKGNGQAYGRYAGEELISYVQNLFHLPAGKENTFVGGVSMGGFGAIHSALQYPETFGKAAAFSSALIIHTIAGQKPGYVDEISDYEYYNQIFGDLDYVAEGSHNPEVLVRNLKERGIKIPELYMVCGTEDFLLESNRRFHEFLQQEEIPVTYLEKTGGHDWVFWNEWLEDTIVWLLKE